MAALQSFTKIEFNRLLKKNGFVETTESSPASTLWYHPESCRHFTIPNHSNDIPESILTHYLNAVKKPYTRKQDPDCVNNKQFMITPKALAGNLKSIKRPVNS